MPIRTEQKSSVISRRNAGHPEILGETLAKFEFFENGWNPYSRFLDVDKVDLILRQRRSEGVIYREIQVKFGKLYPVQSRWEREHFDYSTWKFFKADEFTARQDQNDFFIAYVVSRDEGYRGDIFIFPVRDFIEKISCAPLSKGQRRVAIARSNGDSERWLLRKTTRHFTTITDEVCEDVSQYRRNFNLLGGVA